MGSCHSSNTKVKSRKKLDQKSSLSLSQSIQVDDQLDSLTLKNNDLSAYIDLNSSLFQKNSASMSSFSSTRSSESTKQQRAIPVLSKQVYKARGDPHIVTSTSSVITCESKQAKSTTSSTMQIKIEQVQDTKSLKRTSNVSRREFSPFRSFLKPPSAIVNKNCDKSFSSNSSLAKHNQTSSLSSLSSTSSSISANKTAESKPKSNLVAGKKVPKSPIKTSQLPSTSKLKASNSSIPSLAKSENVEKSDKANSPNKRLFSPYKFSSSLIKSTVLTENINRDNSASVDAKKPEVSSTNASKENSTTQTTGLSKLKFSYNKIPSASKNNVKTLNQSKLNKLTEKCVDQPSLLKRDDSAYNSSTSSTVSSSNDAEEAKKEVGEHKRHNIEESVDELNQLIVSSSTIHSAAHQESQETSAMLKPPSNLPPVENGEVITLDLDTYRMLMQDLQNCKIILHKLGAILKEPTLLSNQVNEDNKDSDAKLTEFVNPLLESFYQFDASFLIGNQITKLKITQYSKTQDQFRATKSPLFSPHLNKFKRIQLFLKNKNLNELADRYFNRFVFLMVFSTSEERLFENSSISFAILKNKSHLNFYGPKFRQLTISKNYYYFLTVGGRSRGHVAGQKKKMAETVAG
ncbi:hypothetical protein BpHYR1_012361, partial [Brachionus plicatilis]